MADEPKTADSEKPPSDPDLAELIARWPDLPRDIKERIMELVRSEGN